MSIESEFLMEADTNLKTHKTKKKKVNSKAKGSSNETECKKILNERFKDTAVFQRSPSSGAFVGGSNYYRKSELSEEQNLVFVGDIYCNRKDFRFTIEHKAYHDASFWDFFNEASDTHQWMEQAQRDADSVKKSPLLIVKYNNKKRIAYTHERPFEPVLSHSGWNCYWLEDLLKAPDSFFFGFDK